MTPLLSALRSIESGEIVSARAPSFEQDEGLVRGALCDLVEHAARARVSARGRRLEAGSHRFGFEARGIGVLLAGRARVEDLGELSTGGAFVARAREVEIHTTIPAWFVVADVRVPTWREWLTATYRAQALRDERARRYASNAPLSVSLPTRDDAREGLRALAREWHEQRCGREDERPAPAPSRITANTTIQRRPGAALRLARSERGAHLVHGLHGPILSVAVAQEDLLRFILREDRFTMESLPVEIGEALFVDLATRLIASGAFGVP